ncbi:MAG: SpoIID/LytB domain-containing protein [Faecalibacterium sp.]|nr:SpoIID/LytB domain-containing protein [Faecalibacterium sp.]
MKQTALLTVFFFICSCLLPPAGYYLAQYTAGDDWEPPFVQQPQPTAGPTAEPGASSPQSLSPAAPSDELAPLYILDEGSGQILTVPVRDYLIGAVASEMPITWPDEALKAQAVASHSYALYCKANNDPTAHSGAYFSADPARRQNFMTDAVLRSYWGTAYQANHNRLAALVDEVLDRVVLYEGAAAAASYFAISAGRTEASQNVWNTALPYLQGVDSPADKAAADYARSITYTPQQVNDLLVLELGITPSGSPADYFTDYRYTDAGYVKSLSVCGTAVTGPQLRNALSLRSACFAIHYDAGGDFTITTYGYGHGVGLSQHGAKAMAENGSSWAEILQYYYPGTTLGSAAGLE